MAGPVVRSINLSSRGELQTVSWSLDDRLAVSTDKDIIIMKLDVFRGGSNSTGSEMKTQAIFSTTHLTERPSLWPDLQGVLKTASREVKRELQQHWTYGHLGPKQFTPCWTSLQWSPPGLAANNRTVLAGVTTDHRLIISGLSTSGRPWVQLADLGGQLASRYRQESTSTHIDPQDVEMPGNDNNDDDNNDNYINSSIVQRSAAAVTSAYTNMTSLAPVDMLWSHVMRGGKAQDRCVLLFAAMKNGDIVTWNITLPCTGIDSCCIVDRQRANCDGTVCSLAWSALPGHPQAGILAVGYTDGRVEAVCFSVDPEGPVDVSPYRFTHRLHPHPDYLPAATLAWFTDTQERLTLLCHKKDTLYAQVVSVDFHGNRGKEEGGEWRMDVGPSCQVAMGSGKDDTKVVVSGSTVLLTTGGHIYHLAITTSPTEVGVQCVGEVEIQQPEDPWSCVSMAMSPNTALVVALLRPHFAYNHLNEHFRQPMKVYITPLTTGWTSLANLMFSLKASRMSTTLTDILHLACHTLTQEPITEEVVTMVTEQLKAPPFSEDPVGWRVSRYILFVLKNLLEPLELTEQVEMVMSAQQEVTDRLLCHQITTVCQALQRGQSPDTPIDGSLLNMMLTWVNQEEQRSQVIGSELVGRLRSIVREPRSDVCVLCNNAMDLTNGIAAMCVNNHKFGLCCHTLAVCQNLTHQCCVTCGAIALSAKMLRDLPWVEEENYTQCTLCQSFLYSANSFIRF